MRLKSCLIALVLVLLMATAALAGGKKALVHFVVVPSSVPAEKISEFSAFLDSRAGGLTAFRTHGSHLGSGVGALDEKNISYLVAADKDMSKEIVRFAKEKLGLKDIFLLVWKADRPSQ